MEKWFFSMFLGFLVMQGICLVMFREVWKVGKGMPQDCTVPKWKFCRVIQDEAGFYSFSSFQGIKTGSEEDNIQNCSFEHRIKITSWPLLDIFHSLYYFRSFLVISRVCDSRCPGSRLLISRLYEDHFINHIQAFICASSQGGYSFRRICKKPIKLFPKNSIFRPNYSTKL